MSPGRFATEGTASGEPLIGSIPDYDGVGDDSGLTAPRRCSRRSVGNEPRYLEIIRPDELKFIDLGEQLFVLPD